MSVLDVTIAFVIIWAVLAPKEVGKWIANIVSAYRATRGSAQ